MENISENIMASIAGHNPDFASAAASVIPLVGQDDGSSDAGDSLGYLSAGGSTTSVIGTFWVIFQIFYGVLWLLDLMGSFKDADSGLMAGLYGMAKVDWVGSLTRLGFRLCDIIADTEGKDFAWEFILMMYPLISFVFDFFAVNIGIYLFLFALLYWIAPDLFLDPSVDLREVDPFDFDTLYKPRPGIPAMIATLFSTSKLLYFNQAELNAEGDWGLNMGVFIALFFMAIGLSLAHALLSLILAPWALISLIVFFIQVLVKNGDGLLDFDELTLYYSIYDRATDSAEEIYGDTSLPDDNIEGGM